MMKDKIVNQYAEALNDNRKERVLNLHRIIMGLFPDATVSLKYKMPTYESDTGWTAIANQKHYVSLYTCDEHHLHSFKEKHPKIKTGKGCINFKDSDELPIEELKSVIRSAMIDNKH